MKRILVANDLGPNSARALARAVRLAAADGAAIRVVHSAPDADDPWLATRRRLLTEARLMAEELAQGLLDISVRITSAAAETAILGQAEEFDVDLIVLGAHGEPRLRDALFGTTGTHVVRHADRPVLIVQNDHARPYSQVLIAIEEVETASPMVAAALDLAPSASLTAVHAYCPSIRESLSGASQIDRQEARRASEIEALLTAQQGQCESDEPPPPPRAIVDSGEPYEMITEASEKVKPDLLVMGTRERATYLGSHAVDALFWCPYDVLIVPERARTQAEKREFA